MSIDGDDDVASVESEEDAHQYSCPDQRKFTPRRKARKKRDPLCPDEVEEVLNGYLKWCNDQNSESHCRILHDWTVEQDPQCAVYIYLDGDCVFKQTPQRVAGGCDTLRTKKEQLNHYNAVIVAEGYEPYYITYPECVDMICKMILATLLQNHLLNRNLIFFMDGEKALYQTVEKYFEMWSPVIYLDWYHLTLKVYGCLSNGLKSRRVDDPRTPGEVFKRGPKKGMPKERKKTSISILYARMLCSILWVGNVEEAKAYIKNINPEDIQNPAAVEELLGYLENKGRYITCYALRKRAGLRNSSNIVESANRRMVSCRQKHRGMLWSPAGSIALAALTTLFMNGEENLWFFHHEVSFSMKKSSAKENKIAA